MRILPRINDDVNQEWISDKARHMYEGLKRQRLSFPMARKPDGSFAELKWDEALVAARKAFDKVKGSEIAALIGPHADGESIVALRDLLHRVGCENIQTASNVPKVNVNLRSEYTFNSRINGLDHADFILLVGTNLRSEAPILNSRIFHNVDHYGTEVAIIGFASDNNYVYDHIGTGPQAIEDILSGDHPIREKLAKSEYPMIIVSGNAL